MALSNNIFELITPFINQIQELEFVLDDVKNLRGFDTGEGQQLDNLGEIVVQARETGQDDISYRKDLKLKPIINASNGEPEGVINFVKVITNSSKVIYQEAFPAGVVIIANGDETLDEFPTIIQKLIQVLPSGVLVRSFTFLDPAFTPYAFGDEGAEVTDGDGFLELGFSEIVGGYTAGALAETVI